MFDRIEIATAGEIDKALEVAGTSLTVLEDLDDNFRTNVQNAGRTGDYTIIFDGIDDLIDKARYLQELKLRLNVWDGDAEGVDKLEEGIASYRAVKAMKNFEEIEAELKESKLLHVTMLYDITKNGQFVRGYLSGQRSLDPEVEEDKKIIDAMDQAFHAWMVSQEMISKGGIIYKADDMMDDEGNPTTKVDTKVFSELLQGFPEVAKELSNSVSLSLQKQDTSSTQEPGPQ